ncbi:MAG: phage tail protein [Blastomonas sp.]
MGKVVRTLAMVGLAIAIAVVAPQLGVLLATQIGVSVAVATAVVGAVLSLAGGLLMSALGPNPSAKAQPINFRNANANSTILIGKRRQGGPMVFFHPRKVGSDTFRYFVFACAGHRCKGVVRWYLGDEVVTVNSGGLVTSGPYANAAWLWFARGETDQAANSTFVAECDGKWTSDHRGRGVAAIYAKFKLTKAVVEAGMPTISAEIEGADEIRDPRDDSIGWTDLAVPAAYWWLQLPREEGGFGALEDEVPDDTLLSAWTNICDEDVDLIGGGTEKRYTLNALIETGGQPSAIRDSMVACMAGQHACIGGVFWMRPGYWVPPSATLSERDLSAGFSVPLLIDAQEFATEVSGTYIDPDNLYQPQPVPTRSIAMADVVQADYDLPHITSHTRGQRILEIMLRRGQCEKRVNWPMNFAGLAHQAMQTVQIDTSRYGLGNYAFVIDDWQIDQNFGVPLVLREENPEIYEWSTALELPKSGSATVATPDPVEVVASAAAVAGAVGSYDAAALAALEARIAALEP